MVVIEFSCHLGPGFYILLVTFHVCVYLIQNQTED